MLILSLFVESKKFKFPGTVDWPGGRKHDKTKELGRNGWHVFRLILKWVSGSAGSFGLFAQDWNKMINITELQAGSSGGVVWKVLFKCMDLLRFTFNEKQTCFQEEDPITSDHAYCRQAICFRYPCSTLIPLQCCIKGICTTKTSTTSFVFCNFVIIQFMFVQDTYQCFDIDVIPFVFFVGCDVRVLRLYASWRCLVSSW